MNINHEKEEIAAELKGSLLEFTKTFYPLLTGRDFIISCPQGRESHHITIAKALTRAARLELDTKRLLINVSPGSGKPVWEETLLLRDDGRRVPIKCIGIGDRVLTHAGRFKEVLKIYHQGILETLKITTFSGREIVAAYDHPFLTAKGYRNAKDLIIGDVLGCAVPTSSFGQHMECHEARLLGYFIGDGCAVGGAANITACDLDSIEDIKFCCEKMGFMMTPQQYKRNNVKEHHSKTLMRLNIKNGVREWLKLHNIHGKNSYTKSVPEQIMTGDFNAICNFLAAYFVCDGSIRLKEKNRRDFTIRLTSVSVTVIEQCQHLLTRLGIRSRIRKKVRNQITKIQGNTYTSYDLELSSQDDVYNFQQRIGPFMFHEKGNSLRKHNIQRVKFDCHILPDEIIKIEKHNDVRCMCIEVKDDHTFTANDIIVHNSTMVSMWIAWTLANYPDSRFLYISYSKVLAAKHTETIKRILQLPHYKYLFDVSIRHDSKAREYFQTTAGGAVAAFGSGGAITGQDAGLPGLTRFSGAVIIDDAHKPDEVHSDTIRQSVIENYRETIQQRARGVNVPFIFIGQRLHEDDLAAYLINSKDGYEWEKVILKSIDEAGNAMYPEANPLEMLRIKQDKDPYVFASQYQQDPIPAGGALFKPEWFELLDEEPEMLVTFITADTAETSKSYNDATVFSFWGLYDIENMGVKTGQMGLHWIDCIELRIEPKDLHSEFISFWSGACRHKVPPLLAAIEKKSTGVTLISCLESIRGIQIRNIDRNRSSGSKTQRFLQIQPYVASKCVSMTRDARHVDLCINHMSKITANSTHRHDDIADTLADAIKISLIDKAITPLTKSTDYNQLAKSLSSGHNKINRLRQAAYAR